MSKKMQKIIVVVLAVILVLSTVIPALSILFGA